LGHTSVPVLVLVVALALLVLASDTCDKRIDSCQEERLLPVR
jgi:hypothetical protein